MLNIKDINFSMTIRYTCPDDKQRKSVILDKLIFDVDKFEDDWDEYKRTTVSFPCSCGKYHEVIIKDN